MSKILSSNAYRYFLDISSGVAHSDSTYLDHCLNIYNILESLGCDEEVCLAGLYHSVYGTEYFSTGKVVDRDIVKNLIGKRAEHLAYIFCNIRSRESTILYNTFNFPPEVHYDLVCIEYANIKEQLPRIKDSSITRDIKLCDDLLKIILDKPKHKLIEINNKSVYLFDNVITNSDAEYINEYVFNSLYRPNHSSSTVHYELDSRFSCLLSMEDFQNTRIIPYVQHIAKALNQNIHIGKSYINHYSLLTGTSKHTDNHLQDEITILVFCNKHWDDTWGGELVFYDDFSSFHTAIEFIPKRIVAFDSRIAHKVMPLTRNAIKDRFTIAIKCALDQGLENFQKNYNPILTVEK